MHRDVLEISSMPASAALKYSASILVISLCPNDASQLTSLLRVNDIIKSLLHRLNREETLLIT